MLSLEDWLKQCKEWAKNNQWELIALSAKKRQKAHLEEKEKNYTEAIEEHYGQDKPISK